MEKKYFAVSFVILISPIIAQNYNCYSCQTAAKTQTDLAFSGVLQQTDNPPKYQPECNKFNANLHKVACKSGVCLKTTTQRDSGSFVARYCMDQKIIGPIINSEKEGCIEIPYEKSTFCVCKTDSCNSASLTVVSFLLLVIFAMLSMFV